MCEKKQIITADEFRAFLKEYLKGKVILLDCGHRYQVHPFSNTMIVYCDGETCCHHCGY